MNLTFTEALAVARYCDNRALTVLRPNRNGYYFKTKTGEVVSESTFNLLKLYELENQAGSAGGFDCDEPK